MSRTKRVRIAWSLLRVGDLGVELDRVVAARFVGHAGDGQLGVEAISVKPGGIDATESP